MVYVNGGRGGNVVCGQTPPQPFLALRASCSSPTGEGGSSVVFRQWLLLLQWFYSPSLAGRSSQRGRTGKGQFGDLHTPERSWCM